MSTATTDVIAVSEAYDDKFGNLDVVSHPAVFFLPQFGALLQQAIDRNTPLTRDEVDELFGAQAWEW